MLEKSSTKFLLAVIVLLIFYNSNQVAKINNWDQTLVNPCPNCCYTDSNRPFINRFVPKEEKILVPLFDIDQENQLLGIKEAIFFAKQLNRTLSIPPFFKKIVLAQPLERLTMPQDVLLDLQQLEDSGVRTLDWRLLQKTCDGKFEQFFVLNQNFNCRLTRKDLWDKFLRLINFNLDDNPYPKVDDNGQCGIENSLPDLKSRNYVARSGKNIKDDFGTDAKCVLLAYPFENVDFLGILESQRKNISDDYKELEKTVTSVQIPQFIKRKVSETLRNEEISDFTCIQLRKSASDRYLKEVKDKITEDLLLVKNPDRIEDSALLEKFDGFTLKNPLVNQIVENISNCTEFMDHSDVLKNLIEHEICSSAKKLVLMERNAFMKNLIIENEFENKTIEIVSVPKQPYN